MYITVCQNKIELGIYIIYIHKEIKDWELSG